MSFELNLRNILFRPARRLSHRIAMFVSCLFALAALTFPSHALACACGCGVFDVGTSSLLCSGKGATVFFEYDFMNQNHNWSGVSKAPNAANDDKQIQT